MPDASQSAASVRAAAVGICGGLTFALAAQQMSPIAAAAAFAGVGFVLLVLRSPVVGLYTMAAMVPLERFGRLTDDTATLEISVMRILGMLVFGIVVFRHLLRREPVIVGLPMILWCACVGFALGSLTYSSDVKGGVMIASGEFGNILFLFAVANLAFADSRGELLERAHTTIFVWLVACAAVALYSIADWHFGSGLSGGIPIDEVDPQAGAQLASHRWATVWQDTAEARLSGLPLRRSMGPTSHAAVFGINLLMSIPFFIYALKSGRTRGAARLILIVGLLATGYCILLTNTRAVMLFAGLTLGLCLLSGMLRIRAWMVAAAVIGVILGLAFMPADVLNRAFDPKNYLAANSEAIRVRLDYYEAGLRAIMDHWMAGVGVGNRKVMLSYLKNPIEGQSTMHNIYLQTALDVGLFGFVTFLCFVGSLLALTNRLVRTLRLEGDADGLMLTLATRVMMVTVLLYGLQVDVFFFPLKGWWLIAGIVLALHARVARTAGGGHPAPGGPVPVQPVAAR